MVYIFLQSRCVIHLLAIASLNFQRFEHYARICVGKHDLIHLCSRICFRTPHLGTSERTIWSLAHPSTIKYIFPRYVFLYYMPLSLDNHPVFNIACSRATTVTQLLIFRFFAGFGGSAPQSVGGGTVGDLWYGHIRAYFYFFLSS